MPNLLPAIACAFFVAALSDPSVALTVEERVHLALAQELVDRHTRGSVFIAIGPEWRDPGNSLVKALRTSGIAATPFSKLRTSRARPLAAQGVVLRLGSVAHVGDGRVRVGYDIMTTIRVLDGASTATLVLSNEGWRLEKTEHVLY
jgi:hypothetical protein